MPDDIPISDEHKKGVESLSARSTHRGLRNTRTIETGSENQRRMIYNIKVSGKSTPYIYIHPRTIIAAKFLIVLESCEVSVCQKHSVINALLSITHPQPINGADV